MKRLSAISWMLFSVLTSWSKTDCSRSVRENAVENVENVQEAEEDSAEKVQIGFVTGNGGNENE